MPKKKKKAKPKKLSSKKEKLIQLQALADQCNKKLGEAGLIYLGSQHRPFERVRTGVLAFDYVTGGGLVKSQMIQLTGAESSFKTTLALIAAATVQSEGGTVVWVAGEGFADKKWAEIWGVELEDLMIISTNSGDVALETAATMIESGLVDLLIMDSFQSLGTTRETESGVDDEAYAGAGAPQMWGRMMRKWFSAVNNGAETMALGISQVRSPIGKYKATEPEGSGIYALKHWKAADVFFRRAEMLYEGTADEKRKIMGWEFKLKCLKNKTAIAGRQASFILRYDNDVGAYVDNWGTLIRLAKEYELLDAKGAWIKGYGVRAQGELKFIEAAEEEGIFEELTNDLFELISPN